MITFSEMAQNPSSEKITLVTIDSLKRHKIFKFVNGSIYSLQVDYFVNDVFNGNQKLIKVNGNPGTNQFSFLPSEMKLLVNVGADPKTQDLSVVYRHFLASTPVILPYDLNSGEDVEWLPLVNSIGTLGQQLDDENTGIVLETSSSIDLINTHGYFDSIFDTHIWENRDVVFYQSFGGLPVNQIKKVFRGVIETKDFESTKITFRVKDFVFRLRDNLKLPEFSELDGKIDPSLIGTPKKRIYGQVRQVRTVGIDKILDGFIPSGTAFLSQGSNILTGLNSIYLQEATPEDEIEVIVDGEVVKFGIETVDSNTQITINKISEVSFTNAQIKIIPSVPYQEKNRFWLIAGHKIRTPNYILEEVLSENRFRLSGTKDIFPGDRVLIGTDAVIVKSIYQNELTTLSAVSPTPPIGEIISKLSVQKAYFGKTEMVFARDWVYDTNDQFGTRLLLQTSAEFNLAEEKLLGIGVTFTFGSRTISTGSVVDFRSILKPRDWIRKNSIVSGENTWLEILEVKEQSIITRTPFFGTSGSFQAQIKTLDIINDDSLITCDCLGIEVDGEWVRTAAQVVNHLIKFDSEITEVNESTFLEASTDCPYTMSLVLPENSGTQIPKIRDVITKVNESIFGSLFINSDLQVSYSVLNSDKVDLPVYLNDDDIISYSTETTNEIYNRVKVSYSPFVDIFSGTDAFDIIEIDSDYVNNFIGIKATLNRTVYLYDQNEARNIAERLVFFRSMANTKMTIKTKMNLYLNSVNDKLAVKFDRIFSRFAGNLRRKIGIITGIKKSTFTTEVQLSDLGNLFNRVPSVAPDDSVDYAESSDEDKMKWGYIVDNDSLTPDVETDENLGANTIG